MVPSLGVKYPGSEADHLFPTSNDVTNEWSYTSTSLPPYPMAWTWADNWRGNQNIRVTKKVLAAEGIVE